MRAWCPRCAAERKVPFQATRADATCAVCASMLTAPPKERKPIARKAAPKRTQPISEASPAQRRKVDAFPHCLACGRARTAYVAMDPAHLCPRGRGGCDDELCVVPLCRSFGGEGCHRLFDDGELDLLKKIASRWPAETLEVQHMLSHMNPVEMLERLAGARTQWSDLTAVSA